MRTIRNLIRKILFGRAFGGLEWTHVATLRDRLVKKSQATPEADDDLPGIEYLGWLLARRSKNRMFVVVALFAVVAAGCLIDWGQTYPGRDPSWISVGALVTLVLAKLYYTRRSFLAEARKDTPGNAELGDRAEESLKKAELAVRRLRHEMPECFWALVMRVDATRIVAAQLASCDDVARATVALAQARGRIQNWGEPAIDRIEALIADCGRLWPNLDKTLRLFDPGLLEAASENVIIETAAPSPPAELPDILPTEEQPSS